MDFSEGDLVVIRYYPLSEVVGRWAEVLIARPHFFRLETWYVLRDSTGAERAAAHSWLRTPDWDELVTMLEFDTAQA